MSNKDSTGDSSSSFYLRKLIFEKTTSSSSTVPQKKWYGVSTSRDSSYVSSKNTNVSVGKETFNQPIMSYYSKDPNAETRALMRTRSGGSTVPPKVSQKNVTIPTVPHRPTITSITIGSTTATLYITDVSGKIDNYTYSLDGGETYTVFDPPQTSTTSLDIQDLEPNGVTYQFVIKAINNIGSSNPSNVVSGTTEIISLSAPTINSISIQFNYVILYITNTNNHITNYSYSLDNGTSFTQLGPPQTSNTEVILNYLTENSLYDVVIKALFDKVESPNSNSYPLMILSLPFMYKISTASSEGTDLILYIGGIDDSIEITNYRYSFDGGLNFVNFDPPQTSKTSLTISNLTIGQTYQVSVQYFNSSYESYISNSMEMTVGAPPCPVVSQIVVDGSNLILTISGTDGVNNYYYSLDGGDSYAMLDPPQNSTSSITIYGMVSPTNTYSVTIRAFNDYGLSFPSDPYAVLI